MTNLLYMSSSGVDEETIEFSQELVTKRYEEICVLGAVSPRKHTPLEVGFLYQNALGKEEEAWDMFDVSSSTQYTGDLIFGKLQNKVSFLPKKLRATPKRKTYLDTRKVDHEVTALKNKIGL